MNTDKELIEQQQKQIEKLQKELVVLNLYKNLAQEFGVLVLEPENLLEAIAYKAGEVMRNRVRAAVAKHDAFGVIIDRREDAGMTIRALPGITLEDLK